ncbi:MAG: glucose-1-phosphate adenylyltransferase [Clostridiales bacterium]|nr:glucose-1-phosphate adenylyltransferase [Clostridiales bacterium]
MSKKETIAMLLAGGQGNRLGKLTKTIAKPAVAFGGKYRIIDFPLSNCINSGIDTIGVLTQYQPLELNAYIGSGQPWDLDRLYGGVTILPPYVKGSLGEWYKGTANAIYQNMHFISLYEPTYVVILSGDHIYKANYQLMIEYHKEKKADCTIAVLDVPLQDASRFGIMNVKDDLRIYEFEEKPKEPKSTLASMGVYVFTWEKLKEYLEKDEKDKDSHNDFGKNIIPKMIVSKERVYAYPYKGYWKDVGTVKALWEANMDILDKDKGIDIDDYRWKIYSRNPVLPPQYIGEGAEIKNSFITEGCTVEGFVDHSILFPGVIVKKGARVVNSILMPRSRVEEEAVVEYSIIMEDLTVPKGIKVGEVPEIITDDEGITVYSEEEVNNG